MKSTLQNIKNVVKSCGREDTYVNVNYMIAKRYESCSKDEEGNIHFRFRNTHNYKYVLILEDYAEPEGRELNFALGVELDQERKYLLPGAPEAYVKKEPVVVDTKRIRFRREIPRRIRKEIKDYCTEKKFESFLSLAIPYDIREEGETRSVGVVNIEAGTRDFFESMRDEEKKIMMASVAAFSTLLGRLVEDDVK